jgi:hypothetical protein
MNPNSHELAIVKKNTHESVDIQENIFFSPSGASPEALEGQVRRKPQCITAY